MYSEKELMDDVLNNVSVFGPITVRYIRHGRELDAACAPAFVEKVTLAD